jgi:hypothetical protein
MEKLTVPGSPRTGLKWAGASWGGHLVAESRGQEIVDHLLMEDRSEAARDGGYDPGPVSRAATPGLLLILQVFHKRGCGSMVVHNGHFGQLRWEEKERQGSVQSPPLSLPLLFTPTHTVP